MDKTIYELCADTADMIAERGLARGRWYNPETGAGCLYGSFYFVRHGSYSNYGPGNVSGPEVTEFTKLVARELGLGIDPRLPWREIASWSDHADADEVIAVLRSIAESGLERTIAEMTIAEMEPVNMNPYELAANAATIIEERGHAKHVLVDSRTGGVCLVGALGVAYEGQAACIEEVIHDFTIPKAIGSLVGVGNRWTDAIKWNNERERTAQEVIDVLRAVAAMDPDKVTPDKVTEPERELVLT